MVTFVMYLLSEIRNRMSPLIFSEKDVEPTKLKTLVEAARWAPSCSNNQSWTYIFVHTTDATRPALEAALSRGNAWAKRAPYLVAVGADPAEDCTTNGLPYYAYNAGLSVMGLTIEAEHQGLRVHQMAGWKEGLVKTALGFPDAYRVIVVFALGYEGDDATLGDQLTARLKERLAEPRTRKPRTANFFFGAFNRAR
jgi:nitroreductase